jgi:hypothetical protein
MVERARAFEVADLPPHWATLTEIVGAAARHSPALRDAAIERSEALWAEYTRAGYLGGLLLRQALGVDETTATLFFNRLYRHAGLARARPPSPVAHERDERWMTHTDYCFVNARATGRFPNQTGNFLSAARLLPVLRARAIHLAPFGQSAFGIVYAQDSFSHLSDEVTHAPFEALGLDRRDQLRYFIDCCHLTGKAVGFDLTAHTCGFSKVSFDRPELFRWVRFEPSYQGLWQGMTLDQQYEEPVQAEFAAAIREVTRAICAEHGLASLEGDSVPPARADAVQAMIKAVVRSLGYYPVVPHTWNGVGLPGLRDYDREGGYPNWDYRDEHGDDQSAHAIGVHASFKFHTGLRANQPAVEGTSSWAPTVDYLAGLFPQMHRDYGFDFVRVDYVDHVFRATRVEPDGREVARSEQLSPSQLRTIAARAKEAFAPAGMLADHVGNDIDRYRLAGFSAVLGREVQHPLGKYEVIDLLDFNQRLAVHQRDEPCYGTVVFPIDTHDMGHPALLGRDLAQRDDRATVLLRHWFARFASAGVGHRPKYETMGAQDLSHGIYRANNEPVSMQWGSDHAALAAYHLVEDTWQGLQAEWREGHLAANYVFDEHCWWRVDCPAAGTAYVVVTWLGAAYDWGRALRSPIETVISLADLAPVERIEPVLGVRPAPTSDAVGSIRLDPRDVECTLRPDGALRVRWPERTSWLWRLRLRRGGRS